MIFVMYKLYNGRKESQLCSIIIKIPFFNRGRTIQLDKLKNRIFREIENTDAEEKSLAEYRREMELLLQEKMSHVEELRQIHADINAVGLFFLLT